ncbi:unnamed protein product [Dracunculus medinensis]|uniref:RRM domain-containing protein n=1 Tax=Dracunculus medinensis TaxID=318479 RepID=A0A0N4UK31_DRAME|nr:unnamed protein product [Dracunculus medinensis]
MKQNSKIFSDRSGSRDRSESPRRRSRSRSTEIAEQLCRLHICNFDESIKKNDIEDAFSYVFYSFNNKLVAFFSYQTNFDLKKFGEIDNIWLASYPPLFAFVTFKDKDDARDALKEMDNAYIGRNRIKVANAHPPRRPGERRPPRRYGGYGGFRGGGSRYGGGPRYGGRSGGYRGGGPRYGGGDRYGGRRRDSFDPLEKGQRTQESIHV